MKSSAVARPGQLAMAPPKSSTTAPAEPVPPPKASAVAEPGQPALAPPKSSATAPAEPVPPPKASALTEPGQLPVAPPKSSTTAPAAEPVPPPKAVAVAEPGQLAVAPPKSSTTAPAEPVPQAKASAVAEPGQPADVAPPKPRAHGLPSASVLASSVIVNQSKELLSWMTMILYSGKDEDWFNNKDLAVPRCQEHILYEAWERMVQGTDGKFVFGEDCLADDLESFCQFVAETVPGLPSWERMTGDMLLDTQVDKEEDDQLASPPNKRQRPDEGSVAMRASSELSLAANSGSQLDFSMLHQDGKHIHTHVTHVYIYIHMIFVQLYHVRCVCVPSFSQLCPEDLSPAGCSANALATGSDPEPATEPSKGPVFGDLVCRDGA